MILMGSNFWKVNNESSDKDYIDYITPSRYDLFNCKVTSKTIVNPDGDDYNAKDIRMILRELGKGSLISFQILFSKDEVDDATANQCLMFARRYKHELFEELKPNLMRAVYGELLGELSRLSKLNEGPKYNKAKGNIFRLNYILQCLINNTNPLVTWFENNEVVDYCKGIRSGTTGMSDFKLMEIEGTLPDLVFPPKPKVEECTYLNNLRQYIMECIFSNLHD